MTLASRPFGGPISRCGFGSDLQPVPRGRDGAFLPVRGHAVANRPTFRRQTGCCVTKTRNRVKLVQEFDQLCDDAVAEFVRYCEEYVVVEKDVMVPKKVKVLEPEPSAA